MIYGVYVKINNHNYITEINSDAFLSDLTDYIKIDEGEGDKFRHAQNHYFEKPLRNEDGFWQYRLVDGVPELISEEELRQFASLNKLRLNNDESIIATLINSYSGVVSYKKRGQAVTFDGIMKIGKLGVPCFYIPIDFAPVSDLVFSTRDTVITIRKDGAVIPEFLNAELLEINLSFVVYSI